MESANHTAAQHSQWLRCHISHQPVSMVCVASACNSHPFICEGVSCACQGPHKNHTQRPVHGFLEQVYSPIRQLTNLKEASDKFMQETIGAISADLGKCSQRYNKLMEEYVSKQFKYESLRKKLMNREEPEAKEMTGAHMHGMVAELSSNQ